MMMTMMMMMMMMISQCTNYVDSSVSFKSVEQTETCFYHICGPLIRLIYTILLIVAYIGIADL